MCAFKIKGLNALNKLLSNAEKDIESIIKETLLVSANEILQDAMSRLPVGSGNVKASFAIQVTDSGYTVTIFSDEEVAAYIEFGTGDFAKAYLAGKPQEMVDEAIKFYINGKGKMPAKPYLFPAYLARRDRILELIDEKINAYLKSK